MSPQARMGLFAGGIVGFLILCSACLVGGYWYTHRGELESDSSSAGVREPEKLSGSGKRLADRPVSKGEAKDDLSYILGHRWWKKPPTREQLEEIIRAAIETNRGPAIFIDDSGNYVITSKRRDISFLESVPATPKEMEGRRHFSIELNSPVRPTRADILGEIRSALRVGEYADGPGR